jgi:hypothetical protein
MAGNTISAPGSMILLSQDGMSLTHWPTGGPDRPRTFMLKTTLFR